MGARFATTLVSVAVSICLAAGYALEHGAIFAGIGYLIPVFVYLLIMGHFVHSDVKQLMGKIKFPVSSYVSTWPEY